MAIPPLKAGSSPAPGRHKPPGNFRLLDVNSDHKHHSSVKHPWHTQTSPIPEETICCLQWPFLTSGCPSSSSSEASLSQSVSSSEGNQWRKCVVPSIPPLLHICDSVDCTLRTLCYDRAGCEEVKTHGGTQCINVRQRFVISSKQYTPTTQCLVADSKIYLESALSIRFQPLQGMHGNTYL